MCFKRLFEKKHGLLPPEDTIPVDAAQLVQALINDYGDYVHTIFMDKKYKTCHLAEIMKFLDYNYIDETSYDPEHMDCDDFAVALFGAMSSIPKWSALSFGLCFVETNTGRHAVNIFIDNMNKVWYVEPQNDKIFFRPRDWKPYFILI